MTTTTYCCSAWESSTPAGMLCHLNIGSRQLYRCIRASLDKICRFIFPNTTATQVPTPRCLFPQNIEQFRDELLAKQYSYGRPSIVQQGWGHVLDVHDPFGNLIRACQYCPMDYYHDEKSAYFLCSPVTAWGADVKRAGIRRRNPYHTLHTYVRGCFLPEQPLIHSESECTGTRRWS